MAARKPPELHAYRHLDGGQREVLLPVARLQLHQHLVELWRRNAQVSCLDLSGEPFEGAPTPPQHAVPCG